MPKSAKFMRTRTTTTKTCLSKAQALHRPPPLPRRARALQLWMDDAMAALECCPLSVPRGPRHRAPRHTDAVTAAAVAVRLLGRRSCTSPRRRRRPAARLALGDGSSKQLRVSNGKVLLGIQVSTTSTTYLVAALGGGIVVQ